MKPENLKRSSVSKVQKSNALISAKYKLNLWEMRIFIKMVMMVDHMDAENMEYKLSRSTARISACLLSHL